MFRNPVVSSEACFNSAPEQRTCVLTSKFFGLNDLQIGGLQASCIVCREVP